MNIYELRQETYHAFEVLALSTGTYLGAPFAWTIAKADRKRLPFTNQTFKASIRQQFGDLRRKETWRQAAIHYAALCAAKSALEPYQLVCLITMPEQISNPIRDAYGPEVIEKILSYPEVAARIRIGLEQLVQERPDIAQEFVETYAGAIAPAVGLPIAA